jgi:Tfp pilus assembly protein PilV
MMPGQMNTVYGGEIPQTRVNGETLDQASARVDADNAEHLSVKPQYIPAQDQPDSQQSKLEVLGKQIAGQQAVSATNQANVMARQDLSGKQALERTNAEAASRERVANTNNTNKAALDAQKAKEKADADAKKATDKVAADKAKGEQKRQVVNKMAQDTLDAINDVVDEKGNLTDKVSGVVGTSRMNPLNYVPGSSGQTGNSILDNLSGKVILNLLNEIKSQSASGATGFGNMSDKDLQTLKTAASRLNKSMPKEDYAAEVVRIRDGIKKMLENPSTKDETKKLTAAELIKKHGG